jgi:hypothetical protein
MSLAAVSVTSAQERTALTAVLSRYEQLQNWTATLAVHTETDWDPAIDTHASAEELKKRQQEGLLNLTEDRSLVFRFLDGSCNVHSEVDAKWRDRAFGGTFLELPIEDRTFLPGRAEQSVQVDNRDRPAGLIKASDRIPDSWTFDIGLGLRLIGPQKWLTDADVRRAKIVSQDDSGVTLQFETEQRIHEARFEKRFGYAVTEYKSTFLQENVSASQRVVCSDFRKIDGIYIPFKMVRSVTYIDTQKKERHPYVWTTIVRDFVLNDPHNTPENMLLVWDAKMTPLDTRVDVNIRVGPTSRPLTDAEIAAQVGNAQDRKADLEQRAKERIEAARGANATTAAPRTP